MTASVIPAVSAMGFEKYEVAWAKMYQLGAERYGEKAGFFQFSKLLKTKYRDFHSFIEHIPKEWKILWHEAHFNDKEDLYKSFEILLDIPNIGLAIIVTDTETYCKLLTDTMKPDDKFLDWWNSLEKFVPKKSADDKVAIDFRYRRPTGEIKSVNRMVTTWHWEDVMGNYPATNGGPERKSTREQMSDLMNLTEKDVSGGGKLILMYGPPGSGKTSVISTLGLHWKDWVKVITIMDPEQFFGDASYMMDVVLEETEENLFNLFIIEDAAELLGAESGGPSLSRLLNMADGLIGKGVKALFLITTNVDMSKVHEAIARPGRALAEIEFPKFSRTEAQEWLDGKGCDVKATGAVSLAELYEMNETIQKVGEGKTELEVTGMYL